MDLETVQASHGQSFGMRMSSVSSNERYWRAWACRRFHWSRLCIPCWQADISGGFVQQIRRLVELVLANAKLCVALLRCVLGNNQPRPADLSIWLRKLVGEQSTSLSLKRFSSRRRESHEQIITALKIHRSKVSQSSASGGIFWFVALEFLHIEYRLVNFQRRAHHKTIIFRSRSRHPKFDVLRFFVNYWRILRWGSISLNNHGKC